MVSTTKEVSIDSLHFPKKSALYAAILPGSGHIYNNRYRPENKRSTLWWKLPIIYGGIGASVYSTIFYHKEYKLILDERRARLDPNYIPVLYPETASQYLYPVQETYRKNRDYSIIAGIVVYVLNIIDANVEGHLIHFDASDKLSLNITPDYFRNNTTGHFGAKLILNFKK